MAALFPLHCFGLMFSPVISSIRRELQQSPASSFSSPKLRSSPVSLNRRKALLSPRTRASSEGRVVSFSYESVHTAVGQRRKTNSGVQEEDLIHLRNDAFVEQRGGTSRELVEDPKFVPLNDDDPVFGPPALLLMGFDSSETSKMLQFVKELDGEFLKIILCTEVMLTQSVWDAIHTEQPDLKAVKVAKSLPRICFLSGLSGEEMMMFIDAFPETGLRPAVFAALVPNSADKLLRDVAEEIMGDHEMLSAKQTS